MDSQPTDSNSRSPTEPDPHLVLTDWVRATQEFYQWYCHLDQLVLSAHTPETSCFQKPSYDSGTDGKQLQRDLKLMLATLQKDLQLMDDQEGASKFDRLIAHTSTLLHWSKRIQRALRIEPATLS